MTVQAGTEISLELLIGELEELSCEHQQHETRQGLSHDSGPAKFYARGTCPKCGFFGEIRAVCAAYAAISRSDAIMQCLACGHLGPAQEMSQVLAPINSSTH